MDKWVHGVSAKSVMLIIFLRPKLGLLLTWLKYEYKICQKGHSCISILKLSLWLINILYVFILYNYIMFLKTSNSEQCFVFFHIEQLFQLFNSNRVLMLFLCLIENWFFIYNELKSLFTLESGPIQRSLQILTLDC